MAKSKSIPLPIKSDLYSLTDTVREKAFLAVSFAEDFEKLLEIYKITDYEIFVKSENFAVKHSKTSEVATKKDVLAPLPDLKVVDGPDHSDSFIFTLEPEKS